MEISSPQRDRRIDRALRWAAKFTQEARPRPKISITKDPVLTILGSHEIILLWRIYLDDGSVPKGWSVDKLSWIKELVAAEQQMEDAGIVDMTAGYDPDRQLEEATLDFLNDLKLAFVEAASAFNQLKGSSLGHIRIYGISKTKSDFMLFRNGYKLIFSMRHAGIVSVSYSAAVTGFVPGQAKIDDGAQDILKADWGAFGQLNWTFEERPIQLDYLIRYYMSRFVRDSAK